MALSVLLLLLAAVAQAQKAPTATTDRIEAEALKAVFEKLDQKAEWNTTGDPCSGAATDSTDINDSSINPAIKCDCSDQNNTVCHITGLKSHILSLEHTRTFGINALSGSIPKELGNLTNLVSLYIDSAGLSGELPSSLSKLTRMKILWASDNNFTGQIPDYIGSWNLTDLRFQGNSFQGPLPANLSNLVQLTNLILRNCMISDSLALIDFSKFATASFAVDCGSTRFISGSRNSSYQADATNLGAASYHVTEPLTWGISNVGKFMDTPNGTTIINNARQFQATLDSELFQTARMSPSSLRYYGIGLQNGNYTVSLQFAEFGFEDTESWKSRGRRVFDIYVQGERKEKDFDIKKEAGGKSYTAVKKDYIVSVTKNFVEIHLFWAGKGTCCIPTQGYYGPTISALSLSPNFTPTIGNVAEQNSSTSKTVVIVAVAIGVTILGLVALVGIFLWRKKRRKLSLEQQELYSIVGRPNIFSYGELRSATENFSSSNRLGEGGYGAVYKLSQTSHQGKKQFATEIETISRVQHRNLVKLYGCCLEGNNPLLVYEYMENGSLDKALFGTEKLHIGWPARFEICLGIARGLAYLHEESSIRVVHRDIKASNVLLDANLNPKISDFGLAKLYDDKMTHVSTKVAGTFGYLAPEYAMRGHMTEKVDVFAFGVVLLETLAGRPNYDDVLEEDKIYIFEWVWRLYESERALDIVDPNLTEFNSEEVLRAIHVALLCTQGSPHRRPSMSRVVAMLTGDAEVGEVAAKPSYITEWQIKGGGTTTTTTGSSSTSSSAANGQWSSAPPPPRATSSPKMSSPFLSSVVDEGSCLEEPCVGGDRERRLTAQLRREREMRRFIRSRVRRQIHLHGSVLLIILLLLAAAVAQAQQAPTTRTDPTEAAALNAVFAKLGQKAQPSWNITGDPCTGRATDGSSTEDDSFNPAITCDCTDQNGTVCHITKLKIYAMDASGPIPEELRNLTRLTNLYELSAFFHGMVMIQSIANLKRSSFAIPELRTKYFDWAYSIIHRGVDSYAVHILLFSNHLTFSPLDIRNFGINALSGSIPKEFGNLTNLISLGLGSNNFSGPLPSELGNLDKLTGLWASDNNFTGKIPDYIGSWNLTDLRFQGNSFQGSIPATLSKLVQLTNLRIGDIENGSSSLAFISNMTSLSILDFSYNQLSGNFPSWANEKNLQLNLVANNFVLDNSNNSVLPSGLECLQRNTPCFLAASFAVNCGSNRSISGSDNYVYQADGVSLGAAQYYVTGETKWGVSNVGKFMDAPSNGIYIFNSSRQFQSTLDPELFQTARLSPSSLRYYGIGLENGNYTVTLQFAEIEFEDTKSWKSLGRRVFDIYIQGERKERNFDIRKATGGKSYTAVKKQYLIPVTKNFVEIHLFWAGKGTCCIPAQGYYGPSISALSLKPTLAAIFLWMQKRRKLSLEQQELYCIVGRPNVFSYGQLRSATENFNFSNRLGEGGYGAVYKGKLTDGRVVAVKQLSQTSNQGKQQFATEIETISRVQHRNLVKLYGCCLEGKHPLLVYEYLENGSLDKALFGTEKLNIDWPARFEICLGIARGLAYLHEESSIRVIHRDIKASNVLLDANLNPKISDFGLAKLYDDKKTHVSTKVAGTFGYLAPEYAMRGRMTEKVDVFAFGVVLLEILAGRPNYDDALEEDKIYIFEWAWDLYENNNPLGLVDPKLEEFNREEVLRAIRVALLCTQGSPHQRPPMSRVVTMLAGDVEAPEVVTKPSYITEWQLKGGDTSYLDSELAVELGAGRTGLAADLVAVLELRRLGWRLHCRHRLAAHRFSSPGRGGEVSRRKMGWRMAVSRLLHGCVLVLLLAAAVVQAQQAATRTDPTEAAALNAVFAKLGQQAQSSWNLSGDPCTGRATDGSAIDDTSFNPAITCDCTFQNSTICRITKLKIYAVDASGQIPEELRNLTRLTDLTFGINSLSGPIPKELGNLTNLISLYIDSAGLSGPLPSSLSKLTRMQILWASDNNFTGQIPDYIGSWNLTDLRFQGNSFQGPIPAALSNLVQLSSLRIGDIENGSSSSLAFISNMTSLSILILRNCRISDDLASLDFSKFASLSLLDLSFNNITGEVPATLLASSFAVNSGSNRFISGSDNLRYETDGVNLRAASYYVTGAPTWGVSNVGKFMDAPNGSYIIYSSRQFQNTLDSELFQTSRMSPSSLRYYGIGLENGNYTVTLQFAEFGIEDTQSWKSLGRRGERKEKNFDIRKTAGDKSYTVVKKQYKVPVTKNFLEIHLFWAGKGTCCIPTQGYYGPTISALSVIPADFTPTVGNTAQKNKSTSKTGVIVGVVVGVMVLGLVALVGIFMWRQKRRKLSLEQQELYSIVGRPNVFSYSELRSATENFSSSNRLGEGGYGAVYKGKLTDGRVVAVKQLSQTSHQGKKQFATEIETISRVQHRNLVKLYGCCLEGNNPLLVYEYMENGSLDKALFGTEKLTIDWPERFEICLGIARGLAYLHEESSIRVVHRDIKASNVLIDANLNPKISDFGLAKLYDDKKTHVSTKVAGTFGYLAPEYAMRGHMTEKVDVFAFGVVLLETLAGRPNYDDTLEEDKIYIFEWAWELYENNNPLGLVDPKLKEFNREEVLRAIRVALLCTQGSPHQRPPMSRVVSMLAGDVEVPDVLTKPSYITEWQIKGGNTSFANSAVSGQSSSAPGSASEQQGSSLFLNSVIPEGRGQMVCETVTSLLPETEKRGRRRAEGSRRETMRVMSHLLLHGGVLLLLLAAAAVQAQRVATKTDPTEAAALNAVFAKLGQQASLSTATWNISGDPCTGAATDGTPIDDNPNFNPAIKCDCTFQNNTVCRITKLKIYALDVPGTIPQELRNLTRLTHLNLGQNTLTGPLPSFIGELTNMQNMGLGSNRFNGSLPSELGNLDKLQELYIDSAGLSGPLPSSFSKLTRMQTLWASDNDFTGQIPDYIGNWNLTDLRFQGNSFQGPIPSALSNLVQLSSLRIGDIENGSSSSLAFIGNMTSLSILILRNCKISDNLASIDFSKFASLNLLDLSFNNITGQVPTALLGLNLLNSLKPSKLKRTFTFNFEIFLHGLVGKIYNLSYLQGLHAFKEIRHVFLVLHTSSFAVDCGSNRLISASDNLRYQTDDASLGPASYSVTGAPTWGVSNVGKFVDAPNGSYIIYSSRQFQNTLDSELFQTSRMSPSSLRYYGIGLENGNYTVTLQFAEFGIEDTQTWKSLGRRVFDIYLQGERQEKNFDIRKAAGDKSYTVVKKSYKVPVTKNFLEIHLFWAGKGTCCIPGQGYYGPTISALSVTPAVLGLVALVGIFMWRQKRRKLTLEQQELYSIVGRPNVFSYSELRSATENFSSSNRLGEGGYGAVYKGKLNDGRVVAVKQLSQTSHQGKKQFATEIETISRVQHRNLVKLYGCCLEGNNPLLVYEYMENGSLDKALFGIEKLNIDWPARFDICLGIARGLAYLHEESSIRVVHRDIKASNVLLDANLNPKISDFGLAKLYDDKKTHVSTKVAGTFGYLAPEYAMRGHMTEKVDVFAFGVVLLETLAGRPNYDDTLEEDKIYIFEWAWELYENNNPLGIVDPNLREFNRAEVLRAIHVALLCTQGSPHQRPPMSRVVSMLTGDTEVTDVLMKPSYITEWQIKGGNTSFANSAVRGQSSSAPGSTSQQASSVFLNSIIQEGRLSYCCYLHGCLCVLVLLLCSWRAADAQAQQPPPHTDPTEAAALNAMMARLGLSAPPSWNISGDPCSGAATDDTPLDDNPAFNPAIKDFRKNYFTGPLPAFIGELTALKYITVGINALSGPIPKELGNLTNLVSLALGSNNFNGSLPDELGKLTKLQQLYIDSNDFSGPLPTTLSQLTNLSTLWALDNNFTGQIPDYLGSLTNLTQLRLQGNSFQGPIPRSLYNLVKLRSFVLRNSRISDSLASVDFSKFGSLNLLDLSFNNITGQIPPSIVNLPSLTFLNLVANDFVIDGTDMSGLPWGLNCLQRNTPCFLAASFAVDCGGSRNISGSDNAMYQADNANLGAASYYVAGTPTWGVSTTGRFMDPPNGSYIIYSSRQFDNTLDSGLFQTARMSPSSLRYYGIGLENGNYTVTLQFAEVDFPDVQSWRSRGRRIFDIYIQVACKLTISLGERKEQNFDIRKAAGGKSFTVVKKQYVVPVTKNFLEIHLFWAGKGTCCIPHQGYYGPAISALSATPNFIPTVRSPADNKSRSKIAVIIVVMVGVAVFALAALAGHFIWRQKKRKILLELEELYNIVGRPNVFSYNELRSATENFSSSNLLGEGGYGLVHKGRLSDGRAVAVKQLSQSSNQGKKQFATEIETISRVQHCNLVTLYGCCLESNTPLLVYEYLENGSLDQALFGKGSLNLDWPTRFEICLGLARGIAYLHEDSTVRIVHRDIKASNILGLPKLYDNKKTHVSTKVAGTFGYLAPEYAMRGHMTEKVDVFAFGVVALETVAGESNYQNTLEEDRAYIFERVWELYENGHPLDFVDPKLSEFNSEEVIRVIRVALLCTQGSPHKRPPMSKVVSMLTGDADITEDAAKPSYITEWQIKVGSCHHTGSSQVGSASTPPSSGDGGAGQASSQGAGEGSPLTPSPLFTSIIDEGR
uniref:non-specific serine/threonine protein kinase n=1 Tax=Oryza rufipogon TaxID=4529 RepID=A0A0E0PE31_ORYRU